MVREMIWKREEMKHECASILVQYQRMATAFGDVLPQLPMLTQANNSPFATMKRANAYTSMTCMLVSLLFYGLDFPIPLCGSFSGYGIATGILASYACWRTRNLHGEGREKYLPANAEKALKILVDYLELIPKLIAEMEEIRAEDDEWIKKFREKFDEVVTEEKGRSFSITYVPRMETCRMRVVIGRDVRLFYPNDMDYMRFSEWMESVKELADEKG